MCSEPQHNTEHSCASRVLADAAREYLQAGWSLIPLHGKQPALRSWKSYQTRRPTLSEVKAWFLDARRFPSGLGIVTGKLSQLVVVDCDREEDAAHWQKEYGSSPCLVSTGGGGLHLYYAMPNELEVRNRTGLFGRKIDIRGEGGYATAPPSWHPSGQQYHWQSYQASRHLPTFNPDWLVDRFSNIKLPSDEFTGQVRNAVAYIQKIHARAGEGGHNATFRAACKLRDAGLSEDEALSVLCDWNETNATPPWSEVDLLHKIHSAFNSLTR